MTKRQSNGSFGSSPPFRFTQAQGRIDWAAIDKLDLNRLVRDTDLDVLEGILPSVAHGNLHKYSSRDLSVQSLRRLFEVSQLTVQYLLYVQDRLASDVRTVKGQVERAQAEATMLQSSLAEVRREAEVAKQEARHSRRMLRIALTQAQATTSASAQYHPPPVVIPAPVPPQVPEARPRSPVAPPQPPQSPPAPKSEAASDPESVERLKRLEEGIRELLQWKQVAANPAVTLAQPPPTSNPQSTLPPIRTCTQENTPTNAPKNAGNEFSKPACDSIGQSANIGGPTASPLPAPKFENLANDQYYMQADTQPVTRTPSHYTANQPPEALHPHSPRSNHTSAPPSPSHYSHISFSPGPSPMAPLSSDSSLPSPTSRRQFLRELPHEAVGHERPGVLSRFPHRLSDLRAVRQELQAELESELAAELAAHGIIDPDTCKGLTPAEYLACMDALRQRRTLAASQMSDEDQRREQYMRSTVTWHVDGVTKSVAAATKTTPPSQAVSRKVSRVNGKEGARGAPPVGTTPPGTTSLPPSNVHAPSPVESTLADLGDVDSNAFYSPLRYGTSDGGSTPTTPKRIPELL